MKQRLEITPSEFRIIVDWKFNGTTQNILVAKYETDRNWLFFSDCAFSMGTEPQTIAELGKWLVGVQEQHNRKVGAEMTISSESNYVPAGD